MSQESEIELFERAYKFNKEYAKFDSTSSFMPKTVVVREMLIPCPVVHSLVGLGYHEPQKQVKIGEVSYYPVCPEIVDAIRQAMSLEENKKIRNKLMKLATLLIPPGEVEI